MTPIPHTLPKFLWHYIKRYKLYYAGFLFVATFWAANISLTPFAMKVLIDKASSAKELEPLFPVMLIPALFYVGLGVSLGLVFRLYDWLLMRTYPSMKSSIVQEMFEYVEKHSYSFFQHNFAGSLGNKINDMAKSSAAVITSLIENFFARALSLVIGAITMYLVHPYFACLLVVWSSIFIGASIFLSKRAQSYSEIYSEARSTVVGKVVDSIGNILNVKLFARERYESGHLRVFLDDAIAKEQRGMWYLLKVKVFYSVSITCLISLMIWLLISEREKNNVTLGDFALILTLNMFLIEEVFFLANQLVPFSEEVGTCRQALSIISPPHEIIDLPNAKPLKVSKGEIVFDHVHFHYKKGQSVFKDKSVTIHPGERVGLVGFSGSGKTTFVNLILRFFDVDAGHIWIDGQDIKTVTQASLHSQIAMIPQDPVLFHRSLADNIRYGKLDATEEQVIACSKKAHCHEFIENLSDKYRSLVGERGVKLSGGQRQRIAIARAFLKDAPILIFDEATSSLDSVTENYIQQSFSTLMEGRTAIVIAHRLSTLFHMTRLLIFSEGEIIEDGTHAELLALNGHYAKLWSMQASGFIADP